VVIAVKDVLFAVGIAALIRSVRVVRRALPGTKEP
jgi:hypothetical protein